MMTDDVQKTIYTSLATAVPLMFMYWLNHRAMMRKVDESKTEMLGKVDAVQVNVDKIEKATNSMKDALVQATKEAGLLAGHAQGVKDEKIFQADKVTGDALLIKAAAVGVPVPVKDDALVQVVKDALKEKNQ